LEPFQNLNFFPIFVHELQELHSCAVSSSQTVTVIVCKIVRKSSQIWVLHKSMIYHVIAIQVVKTCLTIVINSKDMNIRYTYMYSVKYIYIFSWKHIYICSWKYIYSVPVTCYYFSGMIRLIHKKFRVKKLYNFNFSFIFACLCTT